MNNIRRKLTVLHGKTNLEDQTKQTLLQQESLYHIRGSSNRNNAMIRNPIPPTNASLLHTEFDDFLGYLVQSRHTKISDFRFYTLASKLTDDAFIREQSEYHTKFLHDWATLNLPNYPIKQPHYALREIIAEHLHQYAKKLVPEDASQNYQDILRILRQAVTLKHFPAADTLTKLCLILQRADEAIRIAEQAIAFDPVLGPVLLADTYHRIAITKPMQERKIYFALALENHYKAELHMTRAAADPEHEFTLHSLTAMQTHLNMQENYLHKSGLLSQDEMQQIKTKATSGHY